MAYTQSVVNRYAQTYTLSPKMEKRIDRLFESLCEPNEQSRMLDLGCGIGLPFLEAFSEYYKTVGVDLSSAMLDECRKNVPTSKLIQADMQTVQFRDASFDVIVASWSLMHIPRKEHLNMFKKIYGWLKGGGVFFYGGPNGDNKGSEEECLGTTVWQSYYDIDTTLQQLIEAGFQIMYGEIDDNSIWIQCQG